MVLIYLINNPVSLLFKKGRKSKFIDGWYNQNLILIYMNFVSAATFPTVCQQIITKPKQNNEYYTLMSPSSEKKDCGN